MGTACRSFLSSVAAAALLLEGCSPPPPIQKEDIPQLVAPLFLEHNNATISAFGEVRVAVDGDVHRGAVEVHWNTTGVFKADFYAPLGIIVGSIHADADRGTVTFEAGTYSFGLSQTMDSLPFAWGRDLSFGEFVAIVLGRMPAAYAALLRRQPDSCSNERRTIYALWKTDSVDVEAKVRKKAPEGRVTFIFKKHPPFRQVIFEYSGQGLAYKIALRENDRNYFLITYKKVKCT
jgi:hypothetical protein